MTTSTPGPKRCLIIEDDELAAESLGMLLTFEGYEVRAAEDGPGGLSLAREILPEAILCDISLPGPLDGLAVARACRADPDLRQVLLIGLSGYGEVEDLENAREAGFDEYLVKPILLESIRKALRAGRRTAP